jgi:hypothetical protein
MAQSAGSTEPRCGRLATSPWLADHVLAHFQKPFCLRVQLSYLAFMPKPITHRMHDPGSIVPHIRPKLFTDNHMSRIKYKYYISNVSKDYDDSQ